MNKEQIEQFLNSDAINASHFARLAFPAKHVSNIHGRLRGHRGKLQEYHYEELRPHIEEFIKQFKL